MRVIIMRMGYIFILLCSIDVQSREILINSFDINEREIQTIKAVSISELAKKLKSSLSGDIMIMFKSSQDCLENKVVENISYISSFTKNSAFDDLIRHCIHQYLEDQIEEGLTIDQASLLLFDLSKSIGSIVFGLKENQLVLDEYAENYICDNRIYYHLFISAAMEGISHSYYSSQDFLNYLKVPEDSDETCEILLSGH
ncbi:hypothetical protein ACFODZ_14970 [Marinicella sediminis]|uniref:Uncharacterized protein n=1 Tax=Marinicella sediminis TaxID=1792834 RepID=A0ABV7JBS1_9GAMM|nr:hypothetical protein [Marinicella sediminis]